MKDRLNNLPEIIENQSTEKRCLIPCNNSGCDCRNRIRRKEINHSTSKQPGFKGVIRVA